jgi:release factor glutamine methyltransferase
MTIRETLAEGSAVLKSDGIESPALDASLLLAEILHTSRASLIAGGPDQLAEESLAAFRRLIKRRRAGECVAYILGRKEFRGLDFAVNPAVLVPRPDTETLVDAAVVILRKNPTQGRRVPQGRRIPQGCADTVMAAKGAALRVLDLCTGSGAAAVSLKHEMPELEVWASDISAGALEIARANAARLIPPERRTAVHFCLGDLFDTLPPIRPPFTLIVSNPPYIPGDQIQNLSPEVRKEPRIALDGGEDGLDIIRNIIAGAPDFLSPGGALLLEADPAQMRTIAGMLEKKGFINIQTYRDLSDQERVIRGDTPGAPR